MASPERLRTPAAPASRGKLHLVKARGVIEAPRASTAATYIAAALSAVWAIGAARAVMMLEGIYAARPVTTILAAALVALPVLGQVALRGAVDRAIRPMRRAKTGAGTIRAI